MEDKYPRYLAQAPHEVLAKVDIVLFLNLAVLLSEVYQPFIMEALNMTEIGTFVLKLMQIWWYFHCLWCSAWIVNVYCHRFSVHLRIYCFSKHPFLLWSWRAALWVEVCTIRIGVESREPWSFCAVYCRSAASTGNSGNGSHSDIASLKKISNNSTCMYPRRIVSVVIRVKVNITNCSPRKDFLNLTLWNGFWGYFGQIWGPKTSLLILTLLLAW